MSSNEDNNNNHISSNEDNNNNHISSNEDNNNNQISSNEDNNNNIRVAPTIPISSNIQDNQPASSQDIYDEKRLNKIYIRLPRRQDIDMSNLTPYTPEEENNILLYNISAENNGLEEPIL